MTEPTGDQTFSPPTTPSDPPVTVVPTEVVEAKAKKAINTQYYVGQTNIEGTCFHIEARFRTLPELEKYLRANADSDNLVVWHATELKVRRIVKKQVRVTERVEVKLG